MFEWLECHAYIRDYFPDDPDAEPAPVGTLGGRAHEPVRPDYKKWLKEVHISWGDGKTSKVEPDNHGVFGGEHQYARSYLGKTVEVQVDMYGHGGQHLTRHCTVYLADEE